MFVLRSLLVVLGTLAGGIGLSILLGNLFGMEPRGWPANLLSLLSSVLSCIVIVRLTRFMRPKEEPVPSEAELERLGLLSEETFEAKRSFTVEEFEDEGPHVFLELVDGRVLCLNGQYLYETVYGWSDESGKDVPRFPCARFRVKWRKHDQFLSGRDVMPLSPYVAPEAEFPLYQRGDWEALGEPCDGVILDRSFDELKSFLAGRETKLRRGSRH